MRPIGKSGKYFLLGVSYDENNNLRIKFCHNKIIYFYGIILFNKEGHIFVTNVRRKVDRIIYPILTKCLQQNDLIISDKELLKVKFSEEELYNSWLKSRVIFNRSI